MKVFVTIKKKNFLKKIFMKLKTGHLKKQKKRFFISNQSVMQFLLLPVSIKICVNHIINTLFIEITNTGASTPSTRTQGGDSVGERTKTGQGSMFSYYKL
jgi:hypothetical protein